MERSFTVLVVDDEDDVLADLKREVGLDAVEYRLAMSRTSAEVEISRGGFDLLICDLVIPSHDGALDKTEDHGKAVQQLAKSAIPGTPCVFFTGYATPRNTRDAQETGGTDDIWGDGVPMPLVSTFEKSELQACAQRVRDMVAGWEGVVAVELDTSLVPSLSDEARMALRIFGRRSGAIRMEISPLGGKSGAETLRANAFDTSGHAVAHAFVKVDRQGELREERARALTSSALLGRNVMPPLVGEVWSGTGGAGALIYRFADDCPRSLFELAQEDEVAAVACLRSLRDSLRPWNDLESVQLTRVADLRRRVISDERLHERFQVPDEWRRFEEKEILVRCARLHGDLHGNNVLVAHDGSPVMIDLRRVADGPACLDPVLMELSVVFLPEQPFFGHSWPSAEHARSWTHIEAYAESCPIPHFIGECRTWANEVAGSREALLATVYADALRQLKYGDTRHDVAVGIASAVVAEALR